MRNGGFGGIGAIAPKYLLSILSNIIDKPTAFISKVKMVA